NQELEETAAIDWDRKDAALLEIVGHLPRHKTGPLPLFFRHWYAAATNRFDRHCEQAVRDDIDGPAELAPCEFPFVRGLHDGMRVVGDGRLADAWVLSCGHFGARHGA